MYWIDFKDENLIRLNRSEEMMQRACLGEARPTHLMQAMAHSHPPSVRTNSFVPDTVS